MKNDILVKLKLEKLHSSFNDVWSDSAPYTTFIGSLYSAQRITSSLGSLRVMYLYTDTVMYLSSWSSHQVI